MPSLRRTFSSPSARSTPYPSSLGIANTRGSYPSRRSSGSDVSTRRVLADIDWWRVADGQREPDAERELNENEDTEATAGNNTAQIPSRSPADTIADALADFALVAGPATIAAELALQQPSTSGPSEVLSENQPGDSIVHSPFRSYGPLGLGPRTPARREASGSSTYSSDSCSSTSSSPDSLYTPRENLSFTFSDVGFSDSVFDSPSIPTETRPVALGAIKSYSFAGFSSKQFDDDDDDFFLPTPDFTHEDLFA
ncbi:uncharacterized protein STEHIDRAFT_119068 [Stereum hirsutum FP-91666 SS1]|uniref:uncharacterized protein n=1 Tax=Stereum hirsutum (strain FP-91666) TaxID=721885 RepID=UPI000440FE98|nr:uncharacterized protein STEHIDRAFT_119068 [Stereum hirsutum FP-91666 SS1]EIM90000.1 hypothetical protein STEHIDRAFT_119068 [Stereum hirsutum FP-91666 SS1]